MGSVTIRPYSVWKQIGNSVGSKFYSCIAFALGHFSRFSFFNFRFRTLFIFFFPQQRLWDAIRKKDESGERIMHGATFWPSHCNAYGWFISSIFIAVFSQTSSRLHPRVSSGCDSLLFLSTEAYPDQKK